MTQLNSLNNISPQKTDSNRVSLSPNDNCPVIKMSFCSLFAPSQKEPPIAGQIIQTKKPL